MPSSYYEAFAKQLVASSRYASVSEVPRDGLRLMEERSPARLEAQRAAEGDPGGIG